MKSKRNQKLKDIADELKRMFHERGITLKYWKLAKSGSCYLYFPCLTDMGQVRIGDHEERSKYGYRWQIRTDLEEMQKVNTNKRHNQYYYSSENLEGAVDHMTNYYNKIKERKKDCNIKNDQMNGLARTVLKAIIQSCDVPDSWTELCKDKDE